MAAADVERLRTVFRAVPGGVDAAEEQWYVGVVLERLGPSVKTGLEVGLRHRVARLCGQRQRAFAHRAQVGARAAQMILLRGEHVGRIGVAANVWRGQGARSWVGGRRVRRSDGPVVRSSREEHVTLVGGLGCRPGKFAAG